MELRHEYALMNCLERVVQTGISSFTKQELKTWYGSQRIGVRTWRDIADRWAGLHEGGIYQPLLIGFNEADYVLVWGEGLTVTDDAWFKDIRLYTRTEEATDE